MKIDITMAAMTTSYPNKLKLKHLIALDFFLTSYDMLLSSSAPPSFSYSVVSLGAFLFGVIVSSICVSKIPPYVDERIFLSEPFLGDLFSSSNVLLFASMNKSLNVLLIRGMFYC